MSCSAHAATSRSTRGPGTSTALSHRRSHRSSHPLKAAALFAHALPGNSGTKHSGSTASCARCSAASPSSLAALSTEASASRITGVACTAATRTVGNWVMRRRAYAPGARSAHGQQCLADRGDRLGTLLGPHHEVLDPHAEAPGEVDPRLNGDDVAGLERRLVALGQARLLVNLEPDPVAEAVAELVAVAGLLDHRPRDRVDLPSSRPGAHRVQAGLLGALDERVDLARLPVELPRGDRPRAVRAVALDLRAPVDHEQRAGRDLDVARLGVGQCAVRTDRDDRGEAWRGRPAMPHLILQRERDRALGAPDQPALERGAERLVGQGGGAADPPQLLRILDAPQVLDGAARGDQLDAVAEL